MSTVININERLEINNVNEDTYEFAGIVKSYLEQISGMCEIQNLNIFRITLTVDGETAEITDIDCFEEDNCFCISKYGAMQRQVTHQVIPAEHPLFLLVDKIQNGKEIQLTAEYKIWHSAYMNVYGSEFFELQFRDEEALSPYVTYECCTEYPEEEHQYRVGVYRFNEGFNGTVSFERDECNGDTSRNWMVCGFFFGVGFETKEEKNKATEILKESFSAYDFDSVDSDDECVWIDSNIYLKDCRISDFIEMVKQAMINISSIDSAPDVMMSAFSTGNDDFIAVRAFVEKGELVIESC